MSDEPFNRVDVVKHLVGEFENVQSKYASDGACDSEPSYMFDRCCCRTVRARKFVSTKGVDWELYDTPGASSAGVALSSAADKVMEMLVECDRSQLVELDRYYGWGLEL